MRIVAHIQSSHVLMELILPVPGECRKDGVVSDFCTILQKDVQSRYLLEVKIHP